MLGNYRSTPHPTTGFSPRYLSMGRQGKTKLPQLVFEHDKFNEVSAREKEVKDKSCDYANAKRGTKTLDYKIGDMVFVKQEKKNKLDTTFEPIPYNITHVQGSMITAERLTDKRKITRNSSFVKKIRLDSDQDNHTVVTVPHNDLDGDETGSYVSDIYYDIPTREIDDTMQTDNRLNVTVDPDEDPVQEIDPIDDRVQEDNLVEIPVQEETRSRYGRVYAKPKYLNEYDTK